MLNNNNNSYSYVYLFCIMEFLINLILRNKVNFNIKLFFTKLILINLCETKFYELFNWGGGGEGKGENYLHAHIHWMFKHAHHETKDQFFIWQCGF